MQIYICDKLMFQGFLIPTQFQELELLQDRDNMNFVRDRCFLFVLLGHDKTV